MAEPSQVGERVFHGIPVSSGVCQGAVVVLGRKLDAVPKRTISDQEVAQQMERFEQALVNTRHQLLEVQRRVTNGMGSENASIFEAHLMVLEDPALIDEVTRRIQEDKVNAEYAFFVAAGKYISALSAIGDEYLRERATDMRDVTNRVLNNLLGRPDSHELPRLSGPCIIIGEDLSPSMTAQLDRKLVLGFATDMGSQTSHTAILARSLQIPAVVGLGRISQQLETGQQVLVDGYSGLLVLNPSDQTLFEYGQLVRKRAGIQEKLQEVRQQPAITLDGRRIALSANVEQASDTEAVRLNGAEGVGLFRTEYLFIHRDVLPSEEEQYQVYRQVAAALKPQPVIIRTLDLGGDKFLSHLRLPQEMNPCLGRRAIRFCLQEPQIFRQQLRAILRASAEGNVKMMYPMISGLEELSQANALLAECQAELGAAQIPFDPNMEVGIMIEIPAAVLIADSLAKRVKFFSVGTNDLIQYSLAVDRVNERIAHLYEPTHPGILRLIKAAVEAAHRHGIWIGVCGEMAGDPELAPLLIGLGVDELSATASAVPPIKYLIRRAKFAEARELAEWALNSESGAEIRQRSQAYARQVAPGLFGK